MASNPRAEAKAVQKLDVMTKQLKKSNKQTHYMDVYFELLRSDIPVTAGFVKRYAQRCGDGVINGYQ